MQKMLKTDKNILRKNLTTVGIVVLVLLIVDQAIKLYIKSNFQPWEHYNILGDWFQLRYTENQGMAFGAVLGNSIWHKLLLSIFRLIAIIGIGYYIWRQAKNGVKLEFLIAIGLIFTGATGNLLDSMFHDLMYPFDPCHQFNWLEGSGKFEYCPYWQTNAEVRNHGFMLASVVDMFQFNFTWPSWVPGLGGKDVFPAIWNLADACITVGVGMIIIRQKKYFPKKEVLESVVKEEEEPKEIDEN